MFAFTDKVPDEGEWKMAAMDSNELLSVGLE